MFGCSWNVVTVLTALFSIKSLKWMMTEMYSGLIPIYENEPDRALFFVFQPKVEGPPVDEIVIWMNVCFLGQHICVSDDGKCVN